MNPIDFIVFHIKTRTTAFVEKHGRKGALIRGGLALLAIPVILAVLLVVVELLTMLVGIVTGTVGVIVGLIVGVITLVIKGVAAVLIALLPALLLIALIWQIRKHTIHKTKTANKK